MDRFRHWIFMGLGRAVLELAHGYTAQHQEAVLEACLQVRAWYDNGHREEYCVDLIDRSGGLDVYRREIVERLDPGLEWRDLIQLLGILRIYAQRGDAEARGRLVDFATSMLESGEVEPMFMASADLVAVDGIGGLLRVASLMTVPAGQGLSAAYLIRHTAERCGRSATDEALQAAARSDHRTAQFLATATEAVAERDHQQANRRDPDLAVSYDTIFERMTSPGRHVFAPELTRWLQQTDEDGRRRAAAGMLTAIENNDRRQMRVFFGAFSQVPLPLDLRPHCDITQDELLDRLITGATQQGSPLYGVTGPLEGTSHPAIRALAERLLHEGHGKAVGLLVNNYQQGDYQRLTRYLQTWTNLEQIDSMIPSLFYLVNNHPEPAAAETLTAHYEVGPCANCRSELVELLIDLDACPDHILQECRYDAGRLTRDIAKRQK